MPIRKLIGQVFVFILFSFLAGCHYPGPPISQSGDTQIQKTPTSFQPIELTSVPETGRIVVDPKAAEEVVWKFLTAYQENRNEMQEYLSQNLQGQLSEEGVDQILQFYDAVMEGFVFQSGTSSQNPVEAMIEVKIQLDGGETIRRFHLIPMDETWVINQIEVVRP
ncbi:MAG: hypothetical protein JEZ06_13295 [Anaerolineaceae bacterium]|nr:hypothetical protein [Anaerolineaceae bacterium]